LTVPPARLIMLYVSIILKENRCLNCAAPLGAPTASLVTCAYCGSEFTVEGAHGYRIPAPRPQARPAALGTVEVGDHPYLVHGRLARGHHSDVFLARRERSLTEVVLLKVAREKAAETGLRREWEVLHKIREQDAYLRYLTNTPILLAQGRCAGRPARLTAVYQWRCGFSFTFAQARQQYHNGVDGRAVVWMWNRILDQLSCLHQAGWAHNDLCADHLLLHPRDHGVALCGWARAARGEGDGDLACSGRCVLELLGSSAPRALRQLALHAHTYPCARALKQELRVVAEAVYGPPKFHHFTLA
jgi:hypothetical protein